MLILILSIDVRWWLVDWSIKLFIHMYEDVGARDRVLACGTARELPIDIHANCIVLRHPGLDALDEFGSVFGTGNHLGEIFTACVTGRSDRAVK